MTSVPDEFTVLRAGLADRFDLERSLGEGGMAVVYLAHDLKHGRPVALKVLRFERRSPEGVERFNREIRIAAGLVHPHILPLLDSGDVDGRLWYTTPFVEGETLRARLNRDGQMAVDEAIALASEIAAGLSHAHARGIIHRDVKPENILLADGRALIADFGIARAVAADTAAGLTGTGVTIGTPLYMSPEQAGGDQPVDARSDLYALACVLFEMLAGEPPFAGSTPQSQLARRLTQQPPSLRAFRPTIPVSLDAVVRRALSLVPADRYGSTEEFARALSDVGTRRATPSRVSWMIGAAALILVSLGYFFMTREAPAMLDVASAEDGVRLAVLPLRVIGGDSLDQYLAAGITRELHSTLSNLNGLRMISQTSVEPYAREIAGVRELGAVMNAEALLEGDLQRSGSVVRVRIRMVDPVDEVSKWSQQYDLTTDDIFRLQSEVAAAVAGVLRIQLSASESRSLSRPPTTNRQAWELYFRARGRAGPVNFDANYAALSRAIDLDSSFAQAWAGRANAILGQWFFADLGPALWAQAESDIARAIALDSNVADAWTARGRMAYTAEAGWRFPAALTAYRKSIALQPSLVEAHNQLGSLFFHYGFFDEAREELDTSLSLDPRDGCGDRTSCVGFSTPRVARVLWYGQQFEAALAMYDQILFLGPWAWEKAVILNALGRTEEGITLLNSTEGQGSRVADREAALGLLHATLGHEAEAVSHIATAAAAATNAEVGGASHFHHAQFSIACAYARLGRNAEAVELLRQTAANGMPNYPLFRGDPNLRMLQGDREYEELMTEIQEQFEGWARMVRADH